MKRSAAILLVIFLFTGAANLSAQTKRNLAKWFAPMCDKIEDYLQGRTTMNGNISVERIAIKNQKTLQIYFSRYLSDCTLRSDDIPAIYDIIASQMPENYRSYRNNCEAFAGGTPLESLVGRYASGLGRDAAAKGNAFDRCQTPLVRNISRGTEAYKGLQGRHIALWQSHGYYYDQSQSRWKWQRPRLFCTVEDLYTQSYVLPFLVPMLENAGAVVMLPRERDIQTAELIVDRDTSPRDGTYSETDAEKEWRDAPGKGFAHIREIYRQGENPFMDGGARQAESVLQEGDASIAKWEPDIKNSGEYAVYISYVTLPESTTGALYTVNHNGGSTRFLVNQTMGGGTWIYLGTFGFSKGAANQGVTLSNFTGRYGEVVTADAVKFGGGMGNIARNPYPTDENDKPRKFDFEAETEISGYPRWCEGSRSWLQWAGMNDTIYSTTRFVDDYVDDYRSRALWVNALCGGSVRNPSEPGYAIPLDLSLAFHSDAGITRTDSIVGTLAIYTRLSEGEKIYPTGGSRDIGREFADIVQTQVVEDIRATFDPDWSRRSLCDRAYFESRVPYVPAMLLELLSHQNFADMRFGLDPAFRFVASRAVYKGMLKFLAYVNDTDYVVQPLPVSSLAADIRNGSACLSWEPTPDFLEPSAFAESYVVYTRITDPDKAGEMAGTPEAGLDGFDNGVAVNTNSYQVKLSPGKIYSFKVAAVNAGGESLCHEIVSVGLAGTSKSADVVIINNFDRISAPASFASADTTLAGFACHTDGGVPYLRDISFCGEQYEFRRSAGHLTTEPSSFGASYGDKETQVIAGNTFDFALLHGAAFLHSGHSFVSVTRDAVCRGRVNLDKYRICDVICGKQVRTPTSYQIVRNGKETARKRVISYSVFPAPLREALSAFTAKGGGLLVSGAYVASDSFDRIYDFEVDPAMQAEELAPEQKFVGDVLKCQWITNKGSSTGSVRTVKSPYRFDTGCRYHFFTKPNGVRYCVESPDGMDAAKGAFVVMRYSDSGIGAAVAYRGADYRCITLGFPLETLKSQSDINAFISDAAAFLK